MNRNYFTLLFLAFFTFQQSYGQTIDAPSNLKDSVIGNKFFTDCYFATSFFINSNWKDKNGSNILFFGSVHFTNIKKSDNRKTIEEFRGELGYQKTQDSNWTKSADKFFLSSIWILNNAGFKHSFSANVKSQFTNTWENSTIQTDTRRIWRSGPLLPLTLTVGYGASLTFEQESYLNFSVASLKFKTIPKSEDYFPEIKTIAKSEKFLLKSDYGINVQWLLRKKIRDDFLWENKLSLFTKTFERKNTTFDMTNIFAFIPFHHLKINIVNKLAYDFLISEKIQYRFELLLGYSIGDK